MFATLSQQSYLTYFQLQQSNADIIDELQNYFDIKIGTLLMNSHPYGIPKQLYRTSNAPSSFACRPASLNNLGYAHSYNNRTPLMRLQQPISNSYVRDMSKTSISVSQSSQLQEKVKNPPYEYYPVDSKTDELVRNMQQKLDELCRKVSKNSEEIKHLKKTQKLKTPSESNLIQEIQRSNSRQDKTQQECLTKIQNIKDQLSHLQGQFSKIQPTLAQKLSARMDQKLLFKMKTFTEERVKQETAKIKLIIENQISKISHELRWEIEKEKTENSSVKSRTQYPFNSTKIVHSQFVEAPYKKNSSSRMSTRGSSESPRSGKILMSKETTYYVDQEGFLLDDNNYYLLDSEEKMIRLNSKMLAELRLEGLLS